MFLLECVPNSTIHSSGIFRTSGNVTVWPSYPYRDYYATIRVSNPESCGRTTTCDMNWRVYFTNWVCNIMSGVLLVHLEFEREKI